MKTKIYLTFATMLAFVCANAQNVGIGQSAPVSKLHVTAPSGDGIQLTTSVTGNLISDGLRITSGTSGAISIQQLENATTSLYTNGSAATNERVVVAAAGNIVVKNQPVTTDHVVITGHSAQTAGYGGLWSYCIPTANGSSYGIPSINYSILGGVGTAGTKTYTFGVAGQTGTGNRSGGVFGLGDGGGLSDPWGSLGYKNSAGTPYGTYSGGQAASTAGGTGFLSNSENIGLGIGSGSIGDIIGSWSKGSVMGLVAKGDLFASYNSGNEFTSGFQADIVTAEDGTRTLAYANTATQLKIYDDGIGKLSAGKMRVEFDANFKVMMAKGQRPTVTATMLGSRGKGVFVESIDENGFVVREAENGTSGSEFTWIAIAKRANGNVAIPSDVLDKDFDKNMDKVMFNESDTKHTAMPIWWDGSKVRFDAIPAGNEKPAFEKTRTED